MVMSLAGCDKKESSEEQEPSYKGWIKIASYNTKALMYSEDKEGIVQELKEIDADIVGIQEIDNGTGRSGPDLNQMEYLAKEAGYPYWSFDKLINHSGGEYGMGLLSRYPILESEVVEYEVQGSADSHVRKYARHLLKIKKKEVAFYNTHLAIRDGNDEVSLPQLTEVLARMNRERYALMTGDFNMKAPVAAGAVANVENIKILNSGDPKTTAYLGEKLAAKYVDNIMTTKNFETYWDDLNGIGLMVSETEYSDHNMVYTYVKIKK